MNIPKSVRFVLSELNKHKFQAFIVGGCVRDLIMGRPPKDWDVATDATPEKIQKIFPDIFYKNKFGTVTVRIGKQTSRKIFPQQAEESPPAADQPQAGKKSGVPSLLGKEAGKLMEIEVTTFRVDEKYTDKRHPDRVRFAERLEEDLARRDFTVNAIAMGTKSPACAKASAFAEATADKSADRQIQPRTTRGSGLPCTLRGTGQNSKFFLVDPFGGQKDIENKIIRAVGEPKKRFDEDALRLMRAARFAIELGFNIEPKTKKAAQKEAPGLQAIAKERIRDELVKILMTPRADEGILLLRELELLQYIIPELEKGVGVTQNRHHIYTVFDHSVISLKFASQRGYNLEVRLAALFHDIAKPQVKQGEGPDATFYAHDILSAKFATRILDRLRFPKKIIEKVAKLIRAHMFVYDVGVVTEASVRRLLRRVDPENMQDLINLRVADRLGSGCPKAVPYKLRHLQYLIEKVSHHPISVKMLKIDGNEIMEILKIKPGPKVGAILDVLLAEALEDPKKNTKKYLSEKVKKLNREDLDKLREMARVKVEERKEEEDFKIKGKYWVK